MMKKKYASHHKKVSDLIPYVNNARTHSDEQINQVAASIKEFGFTNPILIDSENGIIAGHGRVLAAQKLKMKEVPCIVLDGLTESQKKAYILADNKLALNAGWNEELLNIELDGLKEFDFDLGIIGFSEDELNILFSIDDLPDFQPASEDEQGRLDKLDPKWINCPHCGAKFDERER